MEKNHFSVLVRYFSLFFDLHSRRSQSLELDTKSALIYQQATLIKLSETYSRLGSTMTEQGSEAGDQLVITDKIKVISCDLLRRVTESLPTAEYH